MSHLCICRNGAVAAATVDATAAVTSFCMHLCKNRTQCNNIPRQAGIRKTMYQKKKFQPKMQLLFRFNCIV